MSFAHPFAFLLFIPLAFAAWRMLRRSRSKGVKFPAIKRLPLKFSSWRTVLSSIAPWLMIVALSLLIIALARPREPFANEKKNVDAIAIAMVVDVSGSMRALDLTPKGEQYSVDTTRLAIVKKLFAEFVHKRPNDLIGLVTFGTFASARMPLTNDHKSLLDVLKSVDIPTGKDESYTAIGDGLSVALSRIKDAKPKSKVVILLSDGMNNVGARNGAVEPAEAAEVAAKLGIKVYTIGIGSHRHTAPFLCQDFFGNITVQLGESGFDEAELKSIANKTGGIYFSVDDKSGLEKALKDIDELETTPIETDVLIRWNEYFALFLHLGYSLVIVAILCQMVASRRLI